VKHRPRGLSAAQAFVEPLLSPEGLQLGARRSGVGACRMEVSQQVERVLVGSRAGGPKPLDGSNPPIIGPRPFSAIGGSSARVRSLCNRCTARCSRRRSQRNELTFQTTLRGDELRLMAVPVRRLVRGQAIELRWRFRLKVRLGFRFEGSAG